MDSAVIRFLAVAIVISFVKGLPILPEKKVCYGYLNCFSDLSTGGILPQRPDEIAAKWLLPRVTSGVVNYEDFKISQLSTSDKFKVIILSYNTPATTEWVKSMVKELDKSQLYNILVMDWSRETKDIRFEQAVANAKVVSAQVGTFLQSLKDDNSVAITDLHFITNGIGAHIAGNVKPFLANIVIDRITALDPAGRMYEGLDEAERLDKLDANLVEAMYTGIDMGSFSGSLGHVNIYVNGGEFQPGCPKYDTDLGESACNHRRAPEIFNEAITNSLCQFQARPCANIEQWSSQCTTCGAGCYTLGLTKTLPVTEGDYILETNSKAQLCMI